MSGQRAGYWMVPSERPVSSSISAYTVFVGVRNGVAYQTWRRLPTFTVPAALLVTKAQSLYEVNYRVVSSPHKCAVVELEPATLTSDTTLTVRWAEQVPSSIPPRFKTPTPAEKVATEYPTPVIGT